MSSESAPRDCFVAYAPRNDGGEMAGTPEEALAPPLDEKKISPPLIGVGRWRVKQITPFSILYPQGTSPRQGRGEPLPPLPPGEGWGEGETNHFHPILCLQGTRPKGKGEAGSYATQIPPITPILTTF
jgi:hypothetical protein